MRYSFNSKPPKVKAACSSDASRPVLTYAYLDAERAELQATDSYIAVRVPVELEPGDASGFVPCEALERSRKRDAGSLRLNGSADVMGEYQAADSPEPPLASFARPDLGQFPNLPALWPETPVSFRVGINAKFLLQVAEALGAEDTAVTLEFHGYGPDGHTPNPLRAIVVQPHRGTTGREDPVLGIKQAEGLLMPIRVAD